MGCRTCTLVLIFLLSCSGPQPRGWVEVPALKSVYRLNDQVISGAQPGGEAGFAALAKMGVKTILSVDGARPDAATARKYGMRSVHLPIGYDRVTRKQALEIVRAMRDLPAPVYVHCHQGKHRGPTAAMLGLIALYQWTPDRAVETMRTIGTSPRYKGLYQAVQNFSPPSQAQIDSADNRFPEVTAVPPLAQTMVWINQHNDALVRIRDNGWKTLASHPDIDPPHAALQVRELFRELGRTPEIARRPAPFRRILGEAEQAAGELERALRAGKPRAAGNAYGALLRTCTSCHAQYRTGQW